MSGKEVVAKAPAGSARELRGVVRRLRWRRRVALWTAPRGPGRQEQLETALGRLPRRFRVVRIPYGAMPAREICAFALAALDLPLTGDPEWALLEAAAARHAAGERVVLAIEEADHIPLVEAARLADLARRGEGALRLLVVASAGAEEERLRAVLGDAPRRRRRPDGPPRSAVAYLKRLRPRHPLPPGSPPSATPPAPGPARERPVPEPYSHAAAEDALDALARSLRDGGRSVALLGPPGIGKTVLMRRLAGSLIDAFEAVWVPGLALSGEELLRWMVYCRRGRAPAGDPRGAWRMEVARARSGGRDLLVLLDDAGALLPGAAATLAEEVVHGDGALRIALSLCEDGYRSGAENALPGLQRVRLDGHLTPAESVAFLRSQVGPVLDAAVLARVVEEAAGVPAALLRGMTAGRARRRAATARAVS